LPVNNKYRNTYINLGNIDSKNQTRASKSRNNTETVFKRGILLKGNNINSFIKLKEFRVESFIESESQDCSTRPEAKHGTKRIEKKIGKLP
jgi:hypothetical protein